MTLRTPADVAAEFGVTELALIRFAKRHGVPLVEITRGIYRFSESAMAILYELTGREPPEHVFDIEDRKGGINIAHLTHLSAEKIISSAQPWNSLSAVYFLIRDDQIAYVGQSINVHQRLDEHRKKRPFDKFYIIPCEPQFLRYIEAYYIDLLRPTENIDTHSQWLRGIKQNNRWIGK